MLLYASKIWKLKLTKTISKTSNYCGLHEFCIVALMIFRFAQFRSVTCHWFCLLRLLAVKQFRNLAVASFYLRCWLSLELNLEVCQIVRTSKMQRPANTHFTLHAIKSRWYRREYVMIIIVTQEKEAKLCYSHSERMHRDNILQYNTKAFNKAYAFLQVTCLPRNRSFPLKCFCSL